MRGIHSIAVKENRTSSALTQKWQGARHQELNKGRKQTRIDMYFWDLELGMRGEGHR